MSRSVDTDRFKAFNKQILDQFKQDVKETPLGLTVNGTAGVVVATQNFGVLPTKSWQRGTFDGCEFLSDQAIFLYFMKKSAKNGRFSVLGGTFQG